MPRLQNNHVTIITECDPAIMPGDQIGGIKTDGKWYGHTPANGGRSFKSLSGVKRSITNEWNGDSNEYVAVVYTMKDGTFQADVARVKPTKGE
jgi:hypothetical protein